MNKMQWQQVATTLLMVAIIVVSSSFLVIRSQFNARWRLLGEALENHEFACVRFDTDGYKRVFVDDDCCKISRYRNHETVLNSPYSIGKQ